MAGDTGATLSRAMRLGTLLLWCAGSARALTAQARDSTTRTDSSRAAGRLAPVKITGTGARLATVDLRSAHSVTAMTPGTVAPGPAAASELLRALPGVSVFDDQGARLQPELNVRGFIASPVVGEPQGVSVFLDGVRINEPGAQEINFDLIPMDAVRHAELVRGPSSLFGKNTLAGALLLFTDRGESAPKLEAELESGAFGYRGARVTGAGRQGGIDGYLMARFGDEDGWRDQTSSRTRTLFATVGRRRDSSDVALSMLYAHDKIFQAGSLPESYLAVSPRLNYTGGDFFAPELVHVALRGERTLGTGAFRANAFVRNNVIEQYNGNVPPPNTDGFITNLSWGTTVEWSRVARAGTHALSFVAGAEYERDDVKYRFLAVEAPGIPADAASAMDAGCAPSTGVCSRVRVEGDNAALYLQAMLDLAAPLTLTAAVRGDYVRTPYRDLLDPGNDGTSTLTHLSPRIGLAYRPSDALHAYVAINTGFRAPAALELACASEAAPCSLPSALGADPPLRPVVVHDYEGGVTWAPTARNHMEMVAFRSDVHDDILFEQASATRGFFQNVARTRREGVELSGALGLPAGWRAFGSYSYVAATYQAAVQLASAIAGAAPATHGDRFPLSPVHRGTLGIGAVYAPGRATLDGALSMRAVSSQFLRGDEANDHPALPGYAVCDLRASVVLGHVQASLHVTNLFNRRYATFGMYAANAKGPPGGMASPPAGSEPIERFLTPGFPRAYSLVLSLAR